VWEPLNQVWELARTAASSSSHCSRRTDGRRRPGRRNLPFRVLGRMACLMFYPRGDSTATCATMPTSATDAVESFFLRIHATRTTEGARRRCFESSTGMKKAGCAPHLPACLSRLRAASPCMPGCASQRCASQINLKIRAREAAITRLNCMYRGCGAGVAALLARFPALVDQWRQEGTAKLMGAFGEPEPLWLHMGRSGNQNRFRPTLRKPCRKRRFRPTLRKPCLKRPCLRENASQPWRDT